MNVLKTLHNPRTMAKVHGVLTLFWTLMIIPTVLWWKESILWVGLMSVWANIAGHWSSYQAARSEIAGGGKS